MIYSGAGNRFFITDSLDVLCPSDLDGVLVLEKSTVADVKMRIFNRDGSEAAMCGNGLRCVAAHLGKDECLIETASGLHRCGKKGDLYWTELHFSDVTIVEKEGALFYTVDTGVPHWITFSEKSFDALAEKICIEEDVNVDLALLGEKINIRTFERGVGETLACGTGIVASHLALHFSGKVGSEVTLFSKSGARFISKIEGKFSILYGPVTEH